MHGCMAGLARDRVTLQRQPETLYCLNPMAPSWLKFLSMKGNMDCVSLTACLQQHQYVDALVKASKCTA